jgi:hypothetical protein
VLGVPEADGVPDTDRDCVCDGEPVPVLDCVCEDDCDTLGVSVCVCVWEGERDWDWDIVWVGDGEQMSLRAFITMPVKPAPSTA